jgi:acetyl esterase/lipase
MLVIDHLRALSCLEACRDERGDAMNELERLEAELRARPTSLTIEQRRATTDALGDRFALAADVLVEPVNAHGVAAEWSSTPAASSSAVILHLHSGGYVWGSLKSHRHLVSELGRAAMMRTLALDYRRAPEFPFPHALEDAVSGYRFLLDLGFDPRHIAIAGESAGAGLAVALLVRLNELGLQQPACALLFSPWADMTATADSYRRNAERDPVLNREIMQFLAEQYLGERSRESPLASPVFADLKGIAPLTIFVGAAEALLDDALALTRAAGLADVNVRLEIWPKMFHLWATYHQVLAEGRQAVTRAGRLLREGVEAADQMR